MPHRFASKGRRLLALATMLGVGGCTAVGVMVGPEKQDRDWGRPLAVDSSTTIARGTPVQVQLRDGGYVRGVVLGAVTVDSAGAPGTRPALQLGVGNRIQLDRMFETGATLAEPTREQVPDTLVFPFDQLAGLRVPGWSGPGVGPEAAVGLGIDAVVVWVVVASAAFGILLWLVQH